MGHGHVIWLQPLLLPLRVQLRCQGNPGSRGLGLALCLSDVGAPGWPHRGCSFWGGGGCAASLLRPKEPQLIPVPFPLFQGLIVLGEASPPDAAVDDVSCPISAEVKLEPGADRLVSASSRSSWVCELHLGGFCGREDSFKLLWERDQRVTEC